MQSLLFEAIITKSALSDRLSIMNFSVMLFALDLHFIIDFSGGTITL